MPVLEVALRECTVEDVSTLALVGPATFLEAFAGLLSREAMLAHCEKNHSPAAYAKYLSQSTTRAWVAEALPGRAPIGYALLTVPDFPTELVQESDLELRRIYVFSRFHGASAAAPPTSTSESPSPGQALMERAIQAAREARAGRLLLGVHPDNIRALAFYARNGFRRIGTRSFKVGPSTFEDPVLALAL